MSQERNGAIRPHMAEAVDIIARGSGEATFINHTFMVILSDKVDVSNVGANACAPKGNRYSCVVCVSPCPQERYNLNNKVDINPAELSATV